MKRFQIISVLVLALFLGSCFEIVEDITLKKNGGGHIKFILNASQSKTDINGILLLKEINGYPVPSVQQMRSKFNAFSDSLKHSPGFFNVESSFDDENFIMVFEADFDHVKRLNSGVYKVWAKYDSQNARREVYFHFQDNQFRRQPGQLFNFLYRKLKSTDREVLKGATYTSVYRFAQNILDQQCKSAKIAKNRRVSFLKLPLQLMIEKPSYWSNTINLEP